MFPLYLTSLIRGIRVSLTSSPRHTMVGPAGPRTSHGAPEPRTVFGFRAQGRLEKLPTPCTRAERVVDAVLNPSGSEWFRVPVHGKLEPATSSTPRVPDTVAVTPEVEFLELIG